MKRLSIDFDFITALEGSVRRAYVPDPESSQSGITIASGFDIGHRSREELQDAFHPQLARKLLPYAGKIGRQALDFLDRNPLVITEKEYTEITRFAHQQAEARLLNLWNACEPETPFEDLSTECQTLIASVAFQYGDLSKRAPNFWKQVTTGDWQAALTNLRNFGDRYPSRRHKEADLLESWLTRQVDISGR